MMRASMPRPLLLRSSPAPSWPEPARARHFARAAPPGGGSSSVADRSEQAEASTSASSRATAPPPLPSSPPPPPPPARRQDSNVDDQKVEQRPAASASNSPTSTSSTSATRDPTRDPEIERPWRRRLRQAFSALPLSIFTPYTNLPADGRTRTLAEEACDPMERNCQIPMHVWEEPCGVCSGTGSARSASAVRAARGRGRGSFRSSFSTTYHTCVACSGVGYVRFTTARLGPPRGLNGRGGKRKGSSLSSSSLGPLTVGRPAADADEDKYEFSDSDSSSDDDEEGDGDGNTSYSSYSDDEES